MIDISYFVELSGNNSSFLSRIMNIFINETPKDLFELETAFENKNYKKVREISHKLKGLFKSYQMRELTAHTLELEKHAKSEIFSESSKDLIQGILNQYSLAQIEMIKLLEEKNF